MKNCPLIKYCTIRFNKCLIIIRPKCIVIVDYKLDHNSFTVRNLEYYLVLCSNINQVVNQVHFNSLQIHSHVLLHIFFYPFMFYILDPPLVLSNRPSYVPSLDSVFVLHSQYQAHTYEACILP